MPSTPTAAARRATLAVVCVATAILMLDIAVVYTALPSIAADLHAGTRGLKWVVDAYALALAAAVLGAGSWADRVGRKRVFTSGLVLFAASSLACSLAPDLMVLNLSRAVQGIGAAILFACSLALLADAFPAGPARAKALAAYGATIGGAFAVGPLVGGALTEYLDWRAIFLVNVPICLLCVLVTVRGVRESRSAHARRTDWAGQLLAAAALGLLVFGLLESSASGWTSARVLGAFAGALVAAAAFVVVELRIAEPMLPFGLFRDATFSGAQVAAFAISSSLFAVYAYITFYVQAVLGLSPVQAGLVSIPGTVVMFVVAGATAALGSRFDPARLIVGSLLVITVGTLLLLLAGATSSWTALLPGTILAFAGSGVFNPVMSGLVIGAGSDEHAALAVGVNDTFRQTGIALGVAVLGTLLPAGYVGGPRGAADFTAGLHHAYLLSAGISLVGAVAGGWLIRRGTRVRTAELDAVLDAEPVLV